MAKIKVLSKKTIRRKLQKKRKRLRGVELVYPNEKLASIVGPEPRPRNEITRTLFNHVESLGLVDPSKRFVHILPAYTELSWGRSKIRVNDLSRVVLYNLLPGDPTTDPRDPKPEKKLALDKVKILV